MGQQRKAIAGDNVAYPGLPESHWGLLATLGAQLSGF